MLLNLVTLREKLWKYGQSGVFYVSSTQTQRDALDEQLNQVVERYLLSGKWKNTMRKVRVPIYNEMITLPRELNSLLGIRIEVGACGCCPTTVYSRFHEFAHCVGCCSKGTYPVTELAQTFLTPDPGFTLRVKATEPTPLNMTLLRGQDTDWDEYFDSVTLSITNGTTDTTREWNSMPQIQKPVTENGVEMYSVDSDGNETLISVYAPGETIPSYKRYKVPDGCGQALSAVILGKLAFVPATQDTDIIYPGVIGALKMGLMALQAEDTAEDTKAERYWATGVRLLEQDIQEDEGDASVPVFRVYGGFGAGQVINVT